MKKGKVAQDIAALEQPLRPLSLRVNEYTSEPELCMCVDSGAEVTVWPPELFPAEVAMCEVLRTGRDNHTNTSQSWQNSVQSQTWPSFHGSKCQRCASAETVVSLVISDGQRSRRVLHA